MNHTKLVGIIKALVTEAHHNRRYNYGRKNLAKAPLHVPDKAPQLAEKKKEKNVIPMGKTATGQKANDLIIGPSYNSQNDPTRGAVKPQIDTK